MERRERREREERERRERERERVARTQCSSRRGRRTKNAVVPLEGAGSSFLFFRGIGLCGGNLGPLWAFPGLSGACAEIAQLAERKEFGKGCLVVASWQGYIMHDHVDTRDENEGREI